jgi:hypothetical protein
MATNQFSFVRIEHIMGPRALLIETYCPACGSMIAASPEAMVLDFVEKLHVCPESMAFAHSSEKWD